LAVAEPDGKLFQTTKQNVSLPHPKLVCRSELERTATSRIYLTVRQEGAVKCPLGGAYNLDVIISVGYRVKSHRGTQFRIWATQRRANTSSRDSRWMTTAQRAGGGNYFEELLSRIRDIRSSRRFSGAVAGDLRDEHWLRRRAEEASQLFFATSGRTRCTGRPTGTRRLRLFIRRADATRADMGLTSGRPLSDKGRRSHR